MISRETRNAWLLHKSSSLCSLPLVKLILTIKLSIFLKEIERVLALFLKILQNMGIITEQPFKTCFNSLSKKEYTIRNVLHHSKLRMNNLK